MSSITEALSSIEGAPTVEALCERLGWHGECPATGKMRLINPDGPAAAAMLKALVEENERLRERSDALALQADEWEGKYKIVSDMNDALEAADSKAEAMRELVGRALAYLPSTLGVTRDIRAALSAHNQGEGE